MIGSTGVQMKEKIISMNDSLAQGLAKRVIREVFGHKNENLGIDHFPRRKLIREVIKHFKKDIFHVYLGSIKKETSKWELLYGGWSVSGVNRKSIDFDDFDYDKLGFDIDLEIPTGRKTKRIFIILSKHALERLILRRRPYMSTYKEILQYLNKVIKRLLLHCLTYVERMQFVKNEFSAAIDGFIYPIAFDVGVNRNGERALSFMIKTVMPLEFEGAQKLNALHLNDYVKSSISEYWDLIHVIHQ